MLAFTADCFKFRPTKTEAHPNLVSVEQVDRRADWRVLRQFRLCLQDQPLSATKIHPWRTKTWHIRRLQNSPGVLLLLKHAASYRFFFLGIWPTSTSLLRA
jgi:hypothetical protein